MVENMESRVNVLESNVTRHEKDICDHATRIGALELKCAAIVPSLSHISRQLSKMDADIEILKAKPGKRWETAIVTVLSSIISPIIVALLLWALLNK